MSRKLSNRNQMPVALPESEVDLIRFEKNLVTMGFFSSRDLRKAAPETYRKITQSVERDNKRIQVSAEFRCAIGLPTSVDRDKYMAFMIIAMEQKRRLGAVTNPVEFSGYRILSILGKTDSGANYDELNLWIDRMVETTITSEHMIYSATRRNYLKDKVHVFRRVRKRGESDHDGSNQSEDYQVFLEDWVLDNINQSWVVPEDFAAYQKLKRSIAKGIFVQLSLWFYACRTEPFKKDYGELCSLLSITSYKHLSKIKSVLGPSLDELVAIGYLEKWDIKEMKTKSGYMVVLWDGPELRRVLPFHQKLAGGGSGNPTSSGGPLSLAADATLTVDQNRVRDILIARGVSDTKASKMCSSLPLEILEDRLDYICFQISQDTEGRIKNPAGLIISFVEGTGEIPATFETKSQRVDRERRYQEELRKKNEESDRIWKDLIARQEYSKWCSERADKVIRERFTDKELVVQLEAIRKAMSVSDRQQMDRMAPGARRECLMRHLQKEVAAELNLSTYEEWYEANTQTDLFDQ
jgi:hypothetical protein